jgi:exodeoxyribonuclease V gamma subunit
MLNVHLSNRFESLLDALTEEVRQHRGDAFAPLTVIVPSAAVQRAVTLHLAEQLSVCANVEFSYPATWIWRRIGRAVPGVAAASPFDPDTLAWRVHRAFGDAGFVAAHPRLAAYLGRSDAVMRFDLAVCTASLLEQYITYRPEWMRRWVKGQMAAFETQSPQSADEAWQAALWQRIAGELSLADEHPAFAMVRSLEAGQDIDLPQAVHVFGLPALPPIYVALLQQLGRWTDVHFYAVNPCRAYWFDVVSGRRLSWLATRGQAERVEQGHRLLADWGRQTQAFLAALINFDGEALIDDGRFEARADTSLLSALQNSILDLEELSPSSLQLDASDRSIELHVCHSPMRELEVLHDFLLGLFAAQDAPRPGDIVVVTPDLESLAPLVEAVFGAAPPERRIPFAVTGLPERDANPYSRLLLDVCSFVRSRCGVTSLFDLLQHEAVARRFGLDAEALEHIQAWMRGAGIHWALDGGHRSRFDVPGSDKHSVDDGLQRLFLGYALPSAAETPFLERLPVAGVEGSASRSLGALWTVVQALRTLQEQALHDRPAGEWCDLLRQTLDELIAPSSEDLPDLLQLRRSLHALQERLASADATDPVALAVVHAALEDVLAEPARGGVPSGGVTFASLSSLRGLPSRIVCAIGLNDGAVPASSTPCEFDLIAQNTRAGDRQRRVDDRNVFLDLVLAARERLYLSHVGRSVRDNARLPPSILVAELLDYVVSAVASDKDAARRQLVVEHPLQPFSMTCFTSVDARLRSFHGEYAQALRLASQAAPLRLGAAAEDDDEDEEAGWDPRAPFFRQPLAPADAPWHDVPLANLIEFFRNPSSFLLKHRMSIELPRPEDLLDDDEPLLPAFEQRLALAARLLPHALAGLGTEELVDLARSGVEYPAGALGQRQIEAELALLRDYAERVRADTADPTLPPCRIEVPVDVDGALWRVRCDYADLRGSGLARHRYDDTRVSDRLSGWLHHLLLCAGAPQGVAHVTRWHSRDGSYTLNGVPDARDVLAALLRLYALGLQRPLHFFPKSAWTYVTEDDLGKALDKWQVTSFRPYNEGADPAHALALRGAADPLDDEFMHCARTVFGPLLDCVEDPRL